MTEAVLNDWKSAPIDEKLKGMLGFLEKLTLTPQEVTADDIAPLREAGNSDEAIEEAIHVAVVFNMMDRIADSLGFEIPSMAGYSKMADVLLSRGYK